MPFVFPDLVIESILRDGLENARRVPDAIEDVFANLTRSFVDAKYGRAEIDKIHAVIQKQEIRVVHSLHLVNSNLPCISIGLLADTEDVSRAHFGDFESQVEEAYTSQEDLDSLIIVPGFTPDSYTSTTGIVEIPDAVNLTDVYANLLFVDATGTEHIILGGIVNTLGKKQISIAKEATVDLGAGAEIKSSINFRRYAVRGNVEKSNILLGIHTKEPLLTKYIYILVKYFLMSRKKDMISRDFQLSTYNGSDFNKNMQVMGDQVFERFLTVSGMLQPDWRSDLVELIDNVEVVVKVPKDEATTEDVGREDSTVQVSDD